MIYIQEIIPVSEKVSSTHSYVKNDKIAERNGLLANLAAEKQVYYIDVSAAVVSEDGSPVSYTHLLREAQALAEELQGPLLRAL